MISVIENLVFPNLDSRVRALMKEDDLVRPLILGWLWAMGGQADFEPLELDPEWRGPLVRLAMERLPELGGVFRMENGWLQFQPSVQPTERQEIFRFVRINYRPDQVLNADPFC